MEAVSNCYRLPPVACRLLTGPGERCSTMDAVSRANKGHVMTTSSSDYSTVSSLLARFDRESRGMGLRAQDAAELAAWQSDLRARLRAIIGIDTMRACPLDPQIDAPEQCDGYVQTRVVIAVEPDVRMPLYVLTPADLRPGERRAVMLAPHGHGSAGK